MRDIKFLNLAVAFWRRVNINLNLAAAFWRRVNIDKGDVFLSHPSHLWSVMSGNRRMSMLVVKAIDRITMTLGGNFGVAVCFCSRFSYFVLTRM